MPKPLTLVEKRLNDGAQIIATMTGDPDRPAAYSYADNGRSARADVCERLKADGILKPLGDGLFPEIAQTYGRA